MASSTCHVVGVAKRVRLERIVRRDHPAEVTARQGRLNRNLENRAHPANHHRRTLRSRTHWAGNVTASTRRPTSPKRTSEPLQPSSARPTNAPKQATQNYARTRDRNGTGVYRRVTYCASQHNPQKK